MKITKRQFNLVTRAQSQALIHQRELNNAQRIAQLSQEHFGESLSAVAGDAGIPDGTPTSKIILRETPEGDYSIELAADPQPGQQGPIQ
jgi:hypothetical protein